MPAEFAILTPEKVAVQFRVAGIGSRTIAYLVDIFLVLLITMFGTFVLGLLGLILPGPSQLIMALLLLFSLFGYWILFESLWNGQTVGKRLMGIRVKMADGSPIVPAAAFMRNFLRVADFLPSFYTVGLVSMFFSEKGQRLGDIIANTVVVHETRNVEPVALTSPLTDVEHPLEPLVGDVRRMTPDEYVAIKTLCDRYPELPPRIQRDLTTGVWQPVANRLGIPEYRDIHPVYLMEAVVMKYAREHGLL